MITRSCIKRLSKYQATCKPEWLQRFWHLIDGADIEKLSRSIKHHIGSNEAETYIDMLLRNEKCITMRERYTAQCVSIDARDAAHEHAIQKHIKMSLALNRIIDSLLSAKQREQALQVELQRRNDLNIDIENEYGDDYDDDDDEMASPQEQARAEREFQEMLLIESQVDEIKQTQRDIGIRVIDTFENLEILSSEEFNRWYRKNIAHNVAVENMLMLNVQRMATRFGDMWKENETVMFRDNFVTLFAYNVDFLTSPTIVLFLPAVIVRYIESYPVNMALYQDIIWVMYDTRLYGELTLGTVSHSVDMVRKSIAHLKVLNAMITRISDAGLRMNKFMFADYLLYLVDLFHTMDLRGLLTDKLVRQSLEVASRDYPDWMDRFLLEITRSGVYQDTNVQRHLETVGQDQYASRENPVANLVDPDNPNFLKNRAIYLTKKADVTNEVKLVQPKEEASVKAKKKTSARRKKSKKRK